MFCSITVAKIFVVSVLRSCGEVELKVLKIENAFIKSKDVDWSKATNDDNGIPEGWTVIDYTNT